MPTLRATVLATVLTLAALPAAAHAATVTYTAGGTTLTFSADPTEANELQVTRTVDRVVFQELGDVLIAAPACAPAIPSAEVSCPIRVGATEVTGLTIGLGDLDDRLIVGPVGPIAVDAAQGLTGADRLDAAAANGFVRLEGGDGDDTLLAGLGESDLSDGPGADVLTGGPIGARTSYFMGTGPDGSDRIAGGAGLDVAEYQTRTTPLALSADGVANDGESGEGDNIEPAVEAIKGGDRADVITGSNLVDGELSGYGGDDQIAGGAGDDVLFGGEGNDALAGNGGDDVAAATGSTAGDEIGGGLVDAGADTFAGGAGLDTIDYSARSAPVTVNLDGLPNDGESGEGDAVAADVEALIGGRGADVLTAGPGAQRITGGRGPDTIDPGPDVDDVRAGDGNDVVRTQDGGVDAVVCGLGADTVTGDYVDMLDGCETAVLGPPPLPPDTRKPKVKIRSLPSRPRFRHVRRGLRPTISANEPAAFVVELLGAATRAHISARRPYNLTLVKRTIPFTAQARRVRLRPPAALLGARRKLRVRIRVTATDAAGNVRVVNKTLRVRR